MSFLRLTSLPFKQRLLLATRTKTCQQCSIARRQPQRQSVVSTLRQHSSSFYINSCRSRQFHTSRPQSSPIIPLPAMILGLLKSGKLVSFVSLSSKTSLTLLPHTFRRDKGKFVGKILAGIPIVGLTVLVAVGLDQAPNTSRLRFIYLTEEEEEEEVAKAIEALMQPQLALVATRDSEVSLWLQNIVNNLAKVSMDDVRDPVRRYPSPSSPPSLEKIESGKDSKDSSKNNNDNDDTDTEDKNDTSKEEPEENDQEQQVKQYEVSLICDGNTLNAMCAGRYIIVYDLMMQAMEMDETKMAVILSHEMAHSVQRHFVETHGFASLLLMLGDITRGVFWMVTESFGPYVNQKINEAIVEFVNLESEFAYNRQLEREADIVGLKFMAKAGYDPREAINVWIRMAEIEETIKEMTDETRKKAESNRNNEEVQSVAAIMESLISLWFGTSHPPSVERVEYMREHMDEAVALYEEALRLNGPPPRFNLTKNEKTEPSQHSNAFWRWWYSYFKK